jgi:hypothetical protein
MPVANHDELKKTLESIAAKANVPQPSQSQALTPPPLQASRPADMPKTWDYSQLPQFLQDSIDKAKLRYIGGGDAKKYGPSAGVESGDPYAVHVVNPKAEQQYMNHELTHVLQFLHPEAKFAPVAEKGDKYDYGGVEGLAKGKKKLSDYSVEQVAQMVQDYGNRRNYVFDQAEKNQLFPKEFKEWQKFQAAYAPFMRQLGQLGGHKYDEYKADPDRLRDLPEFSSRSRDIKGTKAYEELKQANESLVAAQGK